MKTISFLAALTALVIAGCGSNEATTTEPTTAAPTTLVAYELGSKKKGDKGVCVICNKKEGTTAEEEVVETLDYEGKTYVFCSEPEKAEFISDPKKFTGTQ